MFIVELTYTVPLEAVDQHLEAHIDFLKRQYAAGHFLASGRKVPRSGGIILAQAENQNALQAIIEEDPFHIHQLAAYRITEFVPSMTVPELEFLSGEK
ncbi:MAG: YciI family protein [Bacteroidota bacterium]